MATLGQFSGGRTFIYPYDGRFAQRVADETLGAVKRINKNGRVIYERFYPYAEGVITSLEIKTKDIDGRTFDTLHIVLDNEIELQMPGSTDNAQNKAIINTLLSPDCNISQPLKFIASRDEAGYTRVFVMQNDKGIKRFSTKENPNGVPQPEEKTAMGKTTWDWSKQDEWYYEKLQSLAEKVKSNTVITHHSAPDPDLYIAPDMDEAVNPDDIPF